MTRKQPPTTIDVRLRTSAGALAVGLLALAGLPACGDADTPTDAASDAADLAPDTPATGETAIAGQVLSHVGGGTVGVPGARVWIDGGASTVADAGGWYRLSGVPADTDLIVHTAGPEWDGIDGATRLVYTTTEALVRAVAGDDTPHHPVLLQGCALTVDPVAGAELALAGCGGGGAVEVVVPGGAIEPTGGGPVEPVRVEMAIVDPADPFTRSALPAGREQPADIGGDITVVLGGGEIRLVGALSGEPMAVAEGSAVNVRMPIAALPEGVGPGDLSWSSYDTVAGAWVDEGPGTVLEREDGTFFEIEAPHFTVVRFERRIDCPGGCPHICVKLRPELIPLHLSCTSDGDCPSGRPCVAATNSTLGGRECGCYRHADCADGADCVLDDATLEQVGAGAPGVCRAVTGATVRATERGGPAGGPPPETWELRGLGLCDGLPAGSRYDLEVAYRTYRGTETTPSLPAVDPFTCDSGNCMAIPIALEGEAPHCVAGTVRGFEGRSLVIRRAGGGSPLGSATTDASGGFCAWSVITSPDPELTYSDTAGAYWRYAFQPTAAEDIDCPGIGRCQDLGTIQLECVTGPLGTSCPAPQFQVSIRATPTSNKQAQTYEVSLDASESTGDIAYYSWWLNAGDEFQPTALAVSPSLPEPTFTLDELRPGIYVIELTLHDAYGFPTTSSRVITVGDACSAEGLPEEDCNDNSVRDSCELAELGDCNGNDQIDACDITDGLSDDLDDDGVPDECASGPVVIEDDTFDLQDWEIVDTTCTGASTHDDPEQRGLSDSPANPYRWEQHTVASGAGEGCTERATGGSIAARHRYLGASYDPTTQGAIDRIDIAWSRFAEFTGAMAMSDIPVIYQNDLPYHLFGAQETALDTTDGVWEAISLTGLTAASFRCGAVVEECAGQPEQPDLATGGVLTFGYLRNARNLFGDGQTTSGLDDWVITLHRAGE